MLGQVVACLLLWLGWAIRRCRIYLFRLEFISEWILCKVFRLPPGLLCRRQLGVCLLLHFLLGEPHLAKVLDIQPLLLLHKALARWETVIAQRANVSLYQILDLSWDFDLVPIETWSALLDGVEALGKLEPTLFVLLEESRAEEIRSSCEHDHLVVLRWCLA